MTGKTHMAVSAAAVAVLLAVTNAGSTHLQTATAGTSPVPGVPNLLARGTAPSRFEPALVAALMLLGVVAGLFPDLDAPDTELQHLPRRMGRRLGDALAAVLPRGSPVAQLARVATHLVAGLISLAVTAVSVLLRRLTIHRGFTHTLGGAALFTLLIGVLVLVLTGEWHSATLAGAVWLTGYGSHLAADACTPAGIPLFAVRVPSISSRVRRPIGSRKGHPNPRAHMKHSAPADTKPGALTFHLLPVRLRVRTGTLADVVLVRWISWAVCAVALAACLLARA